MNNGIFFPPYDSLNRRIGVINNFASFSDAQLAAMKSELGLFMDAQRLTFLRDHFKKSGTSRILLEEIYLLDEIFKASHTLLENACIYNFYT